MLRIKLKSVRTRFRIAHAVAVAALLVLGIAAEANEGAEGQEIDREEFRRTEFERK